MGPRVSRLTCLIGETKRGLCLSSRERDTEVRGEEKFRKETGAGEKVAPAAREEAEAGGAGCLWRRQEGSSDYVRQVCLTSCCYLFLVFFFLFSFFLFSVLWNP